MKQLQSLLKIKPGEGFYVAVMFAYSLAAIGGVIIIGRAISRILFLSQLPETAVPYKFILPPLFVVLITILYTRLAPHYQPARLIRGTSYLMMAGVLLLRYLLDTAVAHNFALLAGLYIYFEIIAALVGIQFWTFAADIFDARQAKRLFGLIAAGGVISNIVAGVGLKAAATVIAPKDFLFVVAASLLVCVAAVTALGKRETAVTPISQSQPATSLWQDLNAVRRTPLLVSIGSIMIIMSIVTNIADYQLDLSLQRFFSGNGNGMLSFLGLFQLITGALALTVQLFATNRLMERFGLVTSLLILPASIALGSGFILLTGGILFAAAWPRGSDVVFRYTVNDAALNTLFLPIQPDLRRRAKAILDGIIKPPVIGLLGLVFLFFQQDAAAGAQAGTIMAWSVPVMVLTAVWLILIQQVRGQYRTALADSLRQRRLDLTAIEIDVSDETTIQVLAQSLQDPDELQVIHALSLVTHAPEVDWHPYIIPLLDHPNIQVRLMVLNMMQTSGQAVYAEQIVPQFRAEADQVRAAAIEAYCALQEDGAIEKVVEFLEEENLQIRSAAIVGLTRYGGLDGILQAASYLKAMLTDANAEIRARGAQILGKLGVQNFYRPLIPLLDDPVMRVQISAIRAAGQLRHRALVPHLIHKLGQAVTVLAATDALVAYGAGIEPALAEAMACEGNTAVRLQIPKILQQIPTPQSIQILLAYIDDPYDHLRGRVLQTLTRYQARDIIVPIEKSYLRDTILYEIRRNYLLFVIFDDLGALGRGVLLNDALQTHLNYSSDRLFHLFALLYPQQNVVQIQQGLLLGDARLRANAIELLDNIAERDIKELALPLMEADRATILSIAHSQLNIPSRSLTERLEQLAAHPSPWLRACVLYQIGTLHMTELAYLVADGLRGEEELVRETAVCASKHLLPRHEFRAVCQEKTADSSPRVQQYTQQLLGTLDPSPVT